MTERLAVGSRRSHGIVGVGDGDDARNQGDLLAHDAIRVAAARESLVVGADGVGDRVEHGDALRDLAAARGVLLHLAPLVIGQSFRLEKDRLRRVELADVVHLGGEDDVPQLRLRESELAADLVSERAHAVDVPGGVPILRLELLDKLDDRPRCYKTKRTGGEHHIRVVSRDFAPPSHALPGDQIHQLPERPHRITQQKLTTKPSYVALQEDGLDYTGTISGKTTLLHVDASYSYLDVVLSASGSVDKDESSVDVALRLLVFERGKWTGARGISDGSSSLAAGVMNHSLFDPDPDARVLVVKVDLWAAVDVPVVKGIGPDNSQDSSLFNVTPWRWD